MSCTLRDGTPLPGVTGYRLDMRDLHGLADLAAQVGRLDVLILNAGIIGPDAGPLDLSDAAAFAEVMQVNAFAPLAVARAMLQNMITGARVIAISSQMSWMGYAKADHIAYRMSKVALNKGVQGLATELAPLGISAVAIDPGWVRTDMGGPEAERDADDVAAQITDLADRLGMAQSGRFLKTDGTERAW